MYLVCWNHDCRQTYEAKLFSPTDRDVKCEKCGGTLISPSGKVTLSGTPDIHKTVDPNKWEEESRGVDLKLDELIATMDEDEVAKAKFGSESWLVVKHFGTIRYFKDGHIGDCVPLTFSNLNAKYEIF